jgi:mannosyltransferase OCH1-like enzyme
MIPHSIHQTWRTVDVPLEWQPYRDSWTRLNPGWTTKLWSDEACRSLVATARPDLLDLYDAYPLGIQRADAFRYVLLAAHGGLYVDLDFECLRPISPLLDGAAVVLGLEPAVHAEDQAVQSRGLSRIVCNAFMASTPGHAFWEHVLDLMSQCDPLGPVLDSTGVFLLSRAVESFARPEDLRIVDPELLYPITKWEVWSDGPSTPSMHDRLERAVAVHHWSSSWQRDRLQRAARELAEERNRRKRA